MSDPTDDLRDAVANYIADVLYGGGLVSPLAFASGLIEHPLAPLLADLAKLKAERDEAWELVSGYAAERAPEAMEVLSKDRDHWWKRALAAEAKADALAAEVEGMRAALEPFAGRGARLLARQDDDELIGMRAWMLRAANAALSRSTAP